MGDTKPPGRRWQATLAFPGERIAHMGGGKPLVLCQEAYIHWPVVHTPRPPHRIFPPSLWQGRCADPCALCLRPRRVARPPGLPWWPGRALGAGAPADAGARAGGHPVKVGARAGHETGGAALRSTLWYVRVPAPIIDARVQLPALIGPRPRLQCLLDRGTLPGGQIRAACRFRAR